MLVKKIKSFIAMIATKVFISIAMAFKMLMKILMLNSFVMLAFTRKKTKRQKNPK